MMINNTMTEQILLLVIQMLLSSVPNSFSAHTKVKSVFNYPVIVNIMTNCKVPSNSYSCTLLWEGEAYKYHHGRAFTAVTRFHTGNSVVRHHVAIVMDSDALFCPFFFFFFF